MAILQELVFTNVPAAAGQSDRLAVGHVTNKSVYLSGGVFTVDVQISHDGTLWISAANGDDVSVTAAGVVVAVPETTKFMRLDVTAFTSGTPAGVVLANSSVDNN